jgi:endonuclease YncB( thermonuclease family)
MCRSIICIVLAVIFSCISVSAIETRSGRVVSVIDGDTIDVLNDNKTERIRLFGIDCPERGQPYGRFAKKITSELAYDQIVTFRPVDQDRYSRTVAWVYVDGKCLNEELVKAGAAWHYTRYSGDQNLSDAELYARGRNLGLWQEPDSVPPWEYRREKRISKDRSQIIASGQTGEYHGNVKSRKFHRQGCAAYNCMNCTAVFTNRDDAIRAGYTPCGSCNP